MRLHDGIPVFDHTRMRDDQVQETVDLLSKYSWKVASASVYDAVREYVDAFGRAGLRKKDIVTATGASEYAVRVALEKLEAEGRVVVRLEKTRGKGSPRKRYFLADRRHPWEGRSVWDQLEKDLYPVYDSTRDTAPAADSGIKYHGTATQAVTCSCSACTAALNEWVAHESAWEPRREAYRAAQTGSKRR
jgi:predicted transcriptional regulator